MRVSKQVIVIRTDLGMEAGKAIAQGGHVAQQWLIEHMRGNTPLNEEQWSWLNDLQTIIVKRVKSEAELLKVYEKAKAAGLRTQLFTDVGLTVFDGVHTKTCISIGPHFEDNLEPVIKRLQNLQGI